MHDYKELSIWKRSMEVVQKIYLLTSKYPSNEKFSLVDQIRRAAISVPSKIAEGCGRATNPQTSYFINISLGSLCEIETQVIISSELKFITEEEAELILNEIEQLKKMTWAFIRTLNK